MSLRDTLKTEKAKERYDRNFNSVEITFSQKELEEHDKEIRAKAIDDVFDYLKTQRKGIYMRVDFDDLEIRQYKEKLKAGEIDK